MKRAKYDPAAHEELRGAFAHDEADRPGRGVDLEAAVRRVIRASSCCRSQHHAGLITPHEIRRAKVRRHPYLVVYAVLPDQLVVLAIAHTGKRPGYWRERIEK